MKKSSLLLLAALSSSLLFAQSAPELVADPSFELCSKPPVGEGDVAVLKHWKNANPNSPRYPNGSPDYMHLEGSEAAKLPKSFWGVTKPYDGNAVAGLTLLSDATPNFREYLTTQLAAPLEVGKSYKVTFHLSSGEAKQISKYAADGFGVAFTRAKPEQIQYQVLSSIRPQYEMNEPFFDTGWRAFTFVFEADQPYEYLTLGCFRNDKGVTQNNIITGKPITRVGMSYVFVDGVSVKANVKEE